MPTENIPPPSTEFHGLYFLKPMLLLVYSKIWKEYNNPVSSGRSLLLYI
jgi:hypothetical protein